jgi:hypothetical protein
MHHKDNDSTAPSQCIEEQEARLLAGLDIQRECPFCWDGRIFLGSVGHDGEERFDSYVCRRCNGTGRL